MKYQGLAPLPCFSAILTIIVTVACYVMTVVEGHYKTLFLSVSDIGAQMPESIILRVGSTINEVLQIGIVIITYRLIELRLHEKNIFKERCRKMLLIYGLVLCIIHLANPYIKDSNIRSVLKTSTLAASGIYTLIQQIPLYRATKVSRCVKITRIVLSVVQIMACICRLTFKLAVWRLCSSKHCLQASTNTMIIMEWIALVTSCLGNILLYSDFKILTIKFNKSLTEDWVVLREDIDIIENVSNSSGSDPENGAETLDCLIRDSALEGY